MYFSTGSATEAVRGKAFSKYTPTSVRNRVLYYWRLGKGADALNALEEHSSVTVQRKRQRQSEGAVRTSKKAHSATELPFEEDERADPISSLPHATTPYMKFVQNVLGEAGVLKWRVHATGMDVVAMNDVDLESGHFMKNRFIHLYRRTPEDSEAVYFCTCSMYSTVLHMEKRSGENGNACCHIRFFNDHLIPYYSALFYQHGQTTEVPCTPIGQKIRDSTVSCNVPVVRLDSSKTHHRFSVLSNDLSSCAVVTLQGGRFSCLFGQCKSQKGHTRKAQKIDGTVCEHLKSLNANQEQWNKLCPFNVESDDEESAEHKEAEKVDASLPTGQDIPENLKVCI